MFTSIAVPLDGSPAAETALPYAVSLARGSGAGIDLLHVHRPYRPGEALEALPIYQWEQITEYDVAQDGEAFQAEGERFQALADRLAGEHGLRVEFRALRGPVADEIARYAGSTTDLLVMSTHGFGATHNWLGTVPDAVVRNSAVPVLLVRPAAAAGGGAARIRRVLVPLDGSRFSEAVLRPAGHLARATGAELTLLRVTGNGSAPSFFGSSRVDADEYLAALAEAAPDGVQPPSFKVVAHSDAAAAIAAEAERSAYDLVAMATHGHGGLRSLLLGSTADRVLRRLRHPLMMHRPSPAAARLRPWVARAEPVLA